MTADAKHIISDFGTLTDSDKREVLSELLRIARFIDYPEVEEDALVAAADDIFLEYDRRESGE